MLPVSSLNSKKKVCTHNKWIQANFELNPYDPRAHFIRQRQRRRCREISTAAARKEGTYIIWVSYEQNMWIHDPCASGNMTDNIFFQFYLSSWSPALKVLLWLSLSYVRFRLLRFIFYLVYVRARSDVIPDARVHHKQERIEKCFEQTKNMAKIHISHSHFWFYFKSRTYRRRSCSTMEISQNPQRCLQTRIEWFLGMSSSFLPPMRESLYHRVIHSFIIGRCFSSVGNYGSEIAQYVLNWKQNWASD